MKAYLSGLSFNAIPPTASHTYFISSKRTVNIFAKEHFCNYFTSATSTITTQASGFHPMTPEPFTRMVDDPLQPLNTS